MSNRMISKEERTKQEIESQLRSLEELRQKLISLQEEKTLKINIEAYRGKLCRFVDFEAELLEYVVVEDITYVKSPEIVEVSGNVICEVDTGNGSINFPNTHSYSITTLQEITVIGKDTVMEDLRRIVGERISEV